jgi:hypothetical protein
MPKMQNCKSKYNIFIISFAVAIFSLIILAFFGYTASSKNSNFEFSCQKLGFPIEEEQDALITIFSACGYFTQQKLWEDIHNIGLKNPKKAFNQINKVITISNAIGEKDGLVTGRKYLRKYLLNDISKENSLELIVWWAQSSFNRKSGMERTDLPSDVLEAKKNLYLKSISKLGLLSEISILQENYDAVWVMGGSRERTLERCKYYKKYLHIIENKPKIFALVADDRELFAELDGLSEEYRALMLNSELIEYNKLGYEINKQDSKIQDGIKYMLYLANKEGIPLVTEIIKYNTENESIEGRYPGRTYLNYDMFQGKKITEKEMTQESFSHFLPNSQIIYVSASKAQPITHLNRASSVETAREAAKLFVQDMLSQGNTTAKLLMISNNPYLLRQSLIVEREVRKVIKESDDVNLKVVVHKAGPGANDNVNINVTLSELGALIMERYKDYLFSLNWAEINVENMCSKLSFVSREEKDNKDYTFVPLSFFETLILFFTTNPFSILFSYT